MTYSYSQGGPFISFWD